MKTIIIGHTSGGNFESEAEKIAKLSETDEKVKVEIDGYEAKMDSFHTTPTFEITNDYENVNLNDELKSGKERRRERRRRERKLKK